MCKAVSIVCNLGVVGYRGNGWRFWRISSGDYLGKEEEDQNDGGVSRGGGEHLRRRSTQRIASFRQPDICSERLGALRFDLSAQVQVQVLS